MRAVIDLPNVLGRLDDDHELLRELIRLFLEDLPSRMADIHDAVASRDAKALQLSAHALKGSAGTLAAIAVSEAAKRLEQMGRDGDFTHSQEAYRALETETERLTATLAALAVPLSSH